MPSAVEHLYVFTLIKVKHEGIASAVEPIKGTPLFTAVSTKHPVMIVLNKQHCIVSRFQLGVESLEGDAMSADGEQQTPFSHADQAWQEVGYQFPASFIHDLRSVFTNGLEFRQRS